MSGLPKGYLDACCSGFSTYQPPKNEEIVPKKVKRVKRELVIEEKDIKLVNKATEGKFTREEIIESMKNFDCDIVNVIMDLEGFNKID